MGSAQYKQCEFKIGSVFYGFYEETLYEYQFQDLCLEQSKMFTVKIKERYIEFFFDLQKKVAAKSA